MAVAVVDEVLRKLGVSDAHEVLVGRAPGVGRSSDSVLARDRAREVTHPPQFYAKTRRQSPAGQPANEISITEGVYLALVEAGATDES